MEEGITTKKKETLAFARAAQPQAASRCLGFLPELSEFLKRTPGKSCCQPLGVVCSSGNSAFSVKIVYDKDRQTN